MYLPVLIVILILILYKCKYGDTTTVGSINDKIEYMANINTIIPCEHKRVTITGKIEPVMVGVLYVGDSKCTLNIIKVGSIVTLQFSESGIFTLLMPSLLRFNTEIPEEFRPKTDMETVMMGYIEPNTVTTCAILTKRKLDLFSSKYTVYFDRINSTKTFSGKCKIYGFTLSYTV